jgi:hypothetical protein
MDSSKESVRIFPSPSIVLIDIRKNITLRRAPEALQEAKHLRGLGVAIRAWFSEKCSQSTTFNKSTVLSSHCEEAWAVNFFPEIKASVVPVQMLTFEFAEFEISDTVGNIQDKVDVPDSMRYFWRKERITDQYCVT